LEQRKTMTLPRKETRELSDVERWQIEEIKKGIAEADRGDFVSDEEMQQTLRRLMRVTPRGDY
jgi:predicted transcriptional regulator